MNKIIMIYNKIKASKFWKTLIKNSFLSFFGDCVNSLITLCLTLVIIRKVGNDNNGILVLAQSYMLILDTLINIQSWKSVIQYGQKALLNNDIKLLRGYIKLGTILDISTAIFGAIIAYFGADYIGRMLNWSDVAIQCSKIFAIEIVFHFAGTPTAILRIFDKFNIFAIQKIIAAFLKLIVFIISFGIIKEINIIQITIIYVVTDVLGFILLIALSIKELKKKMNIKEILFQKLPDNKKEFIEYTIWGTLSDTVDIPINYLDVFVLSTLGTNIVSIYKVFKQLVGIISKVTTPIYQAIMPQFSEMNAKGEEQYGYTIVKRISSVVFKLGIPVALVMGGTSKYWLKFIYGDVYAKYWYVFLLYLIAQIYAAAYSTLHPYFESLGKVKESFLICLVANILYVIVALILVKSIGFVGIIFSYIIQILIVINTKRMFIDKKYLKGGKCIEKK